MSILRDLQRNFKSHHLIGLLGVVILIAALSQYSGRKGATHEGRANQSANQPPNPHPDQEGTFAAESEEQRKRFYKDAAGAGNPQPANPAGQNEVFASAAGISTHGVGLPPSCSRQSNTNPADLLPNDASSEFARLNPRGADDLANVNLLQAGYHAGINTVGGSLRNANLQVRSEPPNPQTKVSPWMNSTIDPDLMRVPLELGCGSQ